MKYSGDMELFSKTKQFLMSKGRNFESEKSGNTGKIKIRNKTYFYFNKTTDSSIPNLCKSVTRDAKKWITENPTAKITDSKKVVHYNKKKLMNSLDSLVYGWDIKACYWSIAVREGYISEKTFHKGNTLKMARLQAIGNLNKSKFTFTQKEGVVTKEKIISETSVIWSLINDEIHNMYLDIKKIAGDDLLCWYTDCLYCSKDITKELTDYFKTKKLEIKQENIKIKSLGNNKVNYWSYKNNREMSFRFVFENLY